MVLILLLGGESGSGGEVLYGLIYKFLGENNKDNSVPFSDGKEKELYNVGKYILDLCKCC